MLITVMYSRWLGRGRGITLLQSGLNACLSSKEEKFDIVHDSVWCPTSHASRNVSQSFTPICVGLSWNSWISWLWNVSGPMVKPWQLCRTIGPLLSQRFLLASAKAQPRGGFQDQCKFYKEAPCCSYWGCDVYLFVYPLLCQTSCPPRTFH